MVTEIDKEWDQAPPIQRFMPRCAVSDRCPENPEASFCKSIANHRIKWKYMHQIRPRSWIHVPHSELQKTFPDSVDPAGINWQKQQQTLVSFKLWSSTGMCPRLLASDLPGFYLIYNLGLCGFVLPQQVAWDVLHNKFWWSIYLTLGTQYLHNEILSTLNHQRMNPKAQRPHCPARCLMELQQLHSPGRGPLAVSWSWGRMGEWAENIFDYNSLSYSTASSYILAQLEHTRAGIPIQRRTATWTRLSRMLLGNIDMSGMALAGDAWTGDKSKPRSCELKRARMQNLSIFLKIDNPKSPRATQYLISKGFG